MNSHRGARLLLLAFLVLVMSSASFAGVFISVNFGPPALPVYEQPPCPQEGYMWTPGYWAYGAYGYYWVPGTWVLAPRPGFLWTPAWWGWDGGAFIFHEGYWGPTVGFYGGIAYGFGYFGHGYEGGRWDGDRFYYNRSVTNVNVTNIRNVYNTTVINNTTVNRVSYNGGNGGIEARPTEAEERAGREQHIAPTSVQMHHAQAALANPEFRASTNHGRPSVAATPRAGAFNDRAAVPAREAGGAYKPENNVPRPPNTTFHASDLPAHTHPAPLSTGNTKLDQKYQKQQEQLYTRQEQESQKLQQQQERDHQRLDQQKANDAQRQTVEQRHEQQTMQMEQRHTQQLEHLQAKQQPPSPHHK